MPKSNVLKIEDDAFNRLREFCKEKGLIMKVFVSRLINNYLNSKGFKK